MEELLLKFIKTVENEKPILRSGKEWNKDRDLITLYLSAKSYIKKNY